MSKYKGVLNDADFVAPPRPDEFAKDLAASFFADKGLELGESWNEPKPEVSAVDGVMGREWTLDWGHVTEGPTISSTVRVIEHAAYTELERAYDLICKERDELHAENEAILIELKYGPTRNKAYEWKEERDALAAEVVGKATIESNYRALDLSYAATLKENDALAAQLADRDKRIETLSGIEIMLVRQIDTLKEQLAEAKEMIEHAIALDCFAEGGSTLGWAKKIVGIK